MWRVVSDVKASVEHFLWKYQEELFWAVVIIGGMYLVQDW